MKCFIHRWRIAETIDNGNALPEATERHLAGCPGCRREWETGKALAGRLTVAAKEDRETVPAGLHGQMTDAVRNEAPVGEPGVFARRIWAPLGGVALCLLMAAIVIAFLAGVKVSTVSVVSVGIADGATPLAQVSSVAPAVVALASTAGQAVADPFAPEWSAIERMASAATRTVLAASIERLPDSGGSLND